MPVNVVRKVLGHEQTSTTLDLYTHAPDDYEQRVSDALGSSAAYLLPFEAKTGEEVNEDDAEDDA